MANLKSEKYPWILALWAALGMIFYLLIIPDIFTLVPRQMNFTRDQAIVLAEKKLLAWGYQPGDYNLDVNFNVRKDLLRFIERNVPDSNRREILGQLPAYAWQMTWVQNSDSPRAISSRAGELPSWFERVVIQLDPLGREIGFWATVKEDSNLLSISESQARSMADSLVRLRIVSAGENFVFSRAKTSTSEWGSEYNFTYTDQRTLYGLQPSLNVIITGDRVTKFLYQYDPAQTRDPAWRKYVDTVPFLLLILLLAVVTLIFFVKKLRVDAINFRYGLPPAICAGLFIMLVVLLSSSGESFWGILVGASFAAILTGMGMLISCTTGEALVRESSEEKLLTLDSLYRGGARNSLFAASLLSGLAYGFLLLALTTLVLKMAQLVSSLSLVDFYHDLGNLANTVPFFSGLIWTLLTPIWYQFGIVLLIAGLAAKYSERRFVFLLIMALVFGIGLQGAWLYPTVPLWASLINSMLLGTVLGWVFLRHDFVAVLTAHITFALILTATRFLLIEQTAFRLYGGLMVLIPGLMAVFALIALRHKTSLDQLRHFTPRQSFKIVERARLRRELEIARRVQLSFLPKSNPQIAGLDVASMCLPALDVGGDYYDFIPMGPRHLGVAIGDVSGKGISAAFYMTLTKGFLRSLTRSRLSPRDVMVEINSLFYENVERGHFISLIFGVFDLEKKLFTFARAGHNPILSRKKGAGRSERLCPAGNALGLESGDIFSKVIQEDTVPIEKGDLFVLYTDGFSEAMNGSQQPFGEERLDDLVGQCDGAGAAEIIETIRTTVNEYAGGTPQHDDMTMVVIRIN